MNSIEDKLYELYKEELQNLEIGYKPDNKQISKMIELICLDKYIGSDYPTDNEFLKYLKLYA